VDVTLTRGEENLDCIRPSRTYEAIPPGTSPLPRDHPRHRRTSGSVRRSVGPVECAVVWSKRFSMDTPAMGKLKATNRKFVEELLALKREEMRLVQQELSALEALGSSATSGDDTSEDEYLESSSRRRSQSFQLAPRDPQNRDSSSLTRTQSFSQSVSTTSAGESTPSNLPGKRNTIEEHNDILRKSYSQLEREYFSLRRQLRTMGEPNSPASYDQEVELKSVSRQLEREMERARHLNSLLDESKRERNQAEVELRNERTRLALLRRALQREEESRKVLEVENARYHQMFYSSQSKNGRELGRERSLGCLDQTAHPRLRPAFASYHEEEIPFFSTDSVHVIEPPIGVPPPPAPRRTHRPSARSTGLRRVNTTVRFTMRGEEAIRGGSDKSYMNPNGNDDVENIPSIPRTRGKPLLSRILSRWTPQLPNRSASRPGSRASCEIIRNKVPG